MIFRPFLLDFLHVIELKLPQIVFGIIVYLFQRASELTIKGPYVYHLIAWGC